MVPSYKKINRKLAEKQFTKPTVQFFLSWQVNARYKTWTVVNINMLV